jgi:hypothetical protein
MAFNQVSPASDPLDATAGLGTKDGRGCGDHDQAYTFGRRPRGVAPFPFTVQQYARLLALRGCIGDGLLGADDIDAAGIELEPATAGSDERVARAILQTAGVLLSAAPGGARRRNSSADEQQS